MRIILLGPPGSGKGTQGDLISRTFGFPRVATGDILRQAVRDRTPLGLQAEDLMNRGGLVSDGVVQELVRERIAGEDCRRGYVLDGFPRTVGQAEALEGMDAGRPELALEFRVEAAVLVRRLGARVVCPKCRAVYNRDIQPPRRPDSCDVCGGTLVRREDDRPEVIAERLAVFERETAPLRAFYSARGSYASVDADGPVADVFDRVSARLRRALAEAGFDAGGGRP